MNCIEFRRKLQEEPQATTSEFVAHSQQCDACSQAWHKAQDFEAILQEAFKVDVPDDLESRILLSKDLGIRRANAFLSPRWLSLAASIFAVLLVTGWLGFNVGEQPAYAEELSKIVMEHVYDEPEMLQQTGIVSDQLVASMFTKFGGVVTDHLGDVSFVGPCWIRKQTGLHLVLAGDGEPITVLFMPGEFVKQQQSVRTGGYSGSILPTSFGSMAVVSKNAQSLDQTIDKFKNSVMWGA